MAELRLIEGRLKQKQREYVNPYQLARAIDDYLDDCLASNATRYVSEWKTQSYYKKPITIAGLCFYLGLRNKAHLASLLKDKNEKIRRVIEDTLLYIEAWTLEQSLQPDAPKTYDRLLSVMGYNVSKDAPTVNIMPISQDDLPKQESKSITVNIMGVKPKSSSTSIENFNSLIKDAGDDQDSVNAVKKLMGIEERITQGTARKL